jgi:hypothetical protein
VNFDCTIKNRRFKLLPIVPSRSQLEPDPLLQITHESPWLMRFVYEIQGCLRAGFRVLSGKHRIVCDRYHGLALPAAWQSPTPARLPRSQRVLQCSSCSQPLCPLWLLSLKKQREHNLATKGRLCSRESSLSQKDHGAFSGCNVQLITLAA